MWFTIEYLSTVKVFMQIPHVRERLEHKLKIKIDSIYVYHEQTSGIYISHHCKGRTFNLPGEWKKIDFANTAANVVVKNGRKKILTCLPTALPGYSSLQCGLFIATLQDRVCLNLTVTCFPCLVWFVCVDVNTGTPLGCRPKQRDLLEDAVLVRVVVVEQKYPRHFHASWKITEVPTSFLVCGYISV